MKNTMRYMLAGLALATAMPLSAQLPNTSAAATALGGNYTARARGYEAITWNPALLAAPGRPAFSIGLLMAGGTSGLDPVDLSDIEAWGGQVIPGSVKAAWMEQVRAAGRERGDADGGVTPIAFTAGNFGLQYSVTAYAGMSLNPDAMEALLYGNADENGEPRAFSFAGSSMDFGAVSTVAASYGRAIPLKLTPLPNEHFSVGVTAKYIMGHVVGRAQDAGSTTSGDSVNVIFPVVHSDIENGQVNGSGVGVDVAAAWSAGGWRVGGMLSNIVNTFAWDASKMVYRPGQAFFTSDSSSSDFDTTSYASAPAALREQVENQKFKPTLALGAAVDILPMLTLSADMRATVGEAIQIGPREHVGVGAELKLIPFLPLRAGVAKITDGYQLAGGFGLAVGRFELGVGATLRDRGEGSAAGLTFNAITVR